MTQEREEECTGPVTREAIHWITLPRDVSRGRPRTSLFVSPRLSATEGYVWCLCGCRESSGTHSVFCNWPAHLAKLRFTVHWRPLGAAERIVEVTPSPGIDVEWWPKLFNCRTLVRPYGEEPTRAARANPTVMMSPFEPLRTMVQAIYGEVPEREVHALYLSRLKRNRAFSRFISFVKSPRPSLQTWSDVLTAYHATTRGNDPELEAIKRFAMFHSAPGITFPLPEPAIGRQVLRNNTTRVLVRRSDDGCVLVADPRSREALFFDLPIAADIYEGFSVTIRNVTEFPAWATTQDGRPIDSSTQPREFTKQTRRVVFRFAHNEWRTESENGADFHRTVAALTTHPAAIRRLGLVLDFEMAIDASELGQSGVISTHVRVESEGTPGGYSFPETAYEVTRSGSLELFHAASRTGMTKYGMLASKPHLTLDYLDLDGAMFKLMGFAAQLADEDPPAESTPVVSAPSLRETGIAFVHTRRAEDATALLASRDAVLHAEDVTQGFRVDVKRDAAPFRSLCRRNVEYWLGATEPSTVPPDLKVLDEDSFVGSAADKVGGTEAPAFRVSPALFRWEGWSLAKERPGKNINDEGGLSTNLTLADLNAPIATRIAVVPASVPRLRFGSSYTFRLRAVDLAGNGTSVTQADLAVTVEPATVTFQTNRYRRFQPVDAPLLVPRQEVGPAESNYVLVIRSTDQQAARSSSWLVMPPKGSVTLTELHGLLDTMSASASWNALKDLEGTVPGWSEPSVIAPPTADERGYSERWLSERGYRTRILQAVPYVTDPMSRGAVFCGVPGSQPVVALRFPKSAPLEVRPVVLRISSGPLGASVTGSQLSLRVPQGRTLKVQLLSQLESSDLSMFGLWDWKGNPTPPNLPGEACEPVLRQVTPAQDVTIVHAVQRPLQPTTGALELLEMMATREPNQTNAMLRGTIRLDVPSSGHVAIEGSWSETVDDPSVPDWYQVRHESHAFRTSVPVSTPGEILEVSGVHKLDDTRHKVVSYIGSVESRFVDYFPSEISSSKALFSRQSKSVVCHVPSSSRPKACSPVYVVPTFRRETGKTEQGELKVTRKAGGLRVYLERGWFSSGEQEFLAVVLPWEPFPPSGTGTVYVHPLLEPYLTSWGRDPLWRSRWISRFPRLSDFPGTSHVRSVPLTLKQPGPTPASPPTEIVFDVSLALYEVSLDRQKNLLYADLQLGTVPTYFPFLKLSLARYQSVSIPGYSLSPTVQPVMIQVAPERVLTMRRQQRKYSVVVAGLGFTNPSIYANGFIPNFPAVEVSLEHRSVTSNNEELNWVPVANSTVTLQVSSSSNEHDLTWQGEIELPTGAPHQYRLFIREFQQFGEGLRPDERPGRVEVWFTTVPLAGV